jgi:hypothetical protein
MKLVYLSILLLFISKAAEIEADSHNHAKHKAHAKSGHKAKAKHHHKKDVDAQDIDLMQMLGDPDSDAL